MAKERESVKLQVTVDKELAQQIETLAQRMEVSVSKMSAMLLDAAVEDNEWIVRAVTSRFAKSIAEALGVSRKKAQQATSAAEA